MKNIAGLKFNRLTAIAPLRTQSNGYWIWSFKCSCGNNCEAIASLVWRGIKHSCGCLGKEVYKTANLKHGCKNKRIYNIWNQMKVRCNSKKHVAYSRYGGRGIKVCKRWLKFETFLEDMGHPPSDNHTLDRISNNRGYYKSNCRWATRKEQNRNARTNLMVWFKGKKRKLFELADEHNLPLLLVWGRVRKLGWSVERALTEPVHTEKSRRA